MTIRELKAITDPAVRATLRRYWTWRSRHSRLVPWGPEEREAARDRRRRLRPAVAEVGEPLPLEIVGDGQTLGPDVAARIIIPDANTHGQTGKLAEGGRADSDPILGTGDIGPSGDAGGKPLSEPEGLTVTNNSRGPRWLCPDPACRANRPGHQLYYGKREWTGKEPLRCTVCGKEQRLCESGEMCRLEITTQEEPT